MKRKHVLKSLQDNAKWLETHNRVEGRSQNDWRAQDILVGSVEILGQCHQTLAGWIDEKPYCRSVLGRIQKSWATRDGKRTLRDLISWTEVAVEAATWVESFWVGALPLSKTAPLTTGKDGSDRIVLKAGTYTAKHRDGSGIVREKATGCRDKEAASRVLGDLERRAELVKANVMTAGEDAIADHQDTPLAEHVADFIAHQTAKEVSPVRVANTRSQLRRVMEDCGFRRYADLSGVALERWLLRHAFGTHLSMGGVPPRTAQPAMRHSSIDLTMNVYTDPRLLDVTGAMEALPRLPLDEGNRSREQATGTAGAKVRLHQCLHQNLASPANRGQLRTKGRLTSPNQPSK